MPNTPKIVPYEPRHHPALMALLARFFGEWSAGRLEQRWRWQFDDNPFAKQRQGEIYVLETEGNQVVGHISGVPVPLRVGDKTYVAQTLSGFVSEEEHRLAAALLMRRMTQKPPVVASGMNAGTFKLFSSLGGAVLPTTRQVWTLRRSYAGVITARLRQRLRKPLAPRLSPDWIRPLEPLLRGLAVDPPAALPPLTPAHGGIHAITRFDARYDELWAEAQSRYEACTDRTSTYMNWRYVDCPTQHSVRIGLAGADGRLEGVAVGVLRGARDWTGAPCAKHGMITELITRDGSKDTTRILLTELTHRLDAQKVDSIECIGLAAEHGDILSHLGFSRRDDDTFAVAVRIPDADRQAGPPLDQRKWYATLGDGDSLFAPVL